MKTRFFSAVLMFVLILKLMPAVFASGFTDVSPNSYYASAVTWALETGVTSGVSKSEFAPKVDCTRGQIITFLWRAAGKPEHRQNSSTFTDVPEDTYYHDAVLWAFEQGIAAGISPSVFAPDSPCTRGQAMTFLWRYMKEPAYNDDYNQM